MDEGPIILGITLGPLEEVKAGWCSWLSRILNTDKVLGSNPSLVIPFALLDPDGGVVNGGDGETRGEYLVFPPSFVAHY